MANRPQGLAATQPVHGPTSDPAATNLRYLSWGLILLSAYIGLLAESGLQRAFFPAPPSPPVYLVDMPAPLLAANCALLLFPVCTLLFLGAGLLGLRASVSGVRERLTWRLGAHTFGPLRLVGLLILSLVLAVVVQVGIVMVAVLGGGTDAAASLVVGAAFEALLIAFGWCLMVFPAKALGAWTTKVESKAIAAAVFLISLAALFEAAVQFVAAAAGAPVVAANPNATVPSSYPWADGFTAVAAFAGLLVIAWVARRIVHRVRRSPTQAVLPTPRDPPRARPEYCCSDCGTDLSEDDTVCPHCGAPIEGDEE